VPGYLAVAEHPAADPAARCRVAGRAAACRGGKVRDRCRPAGGAGQALGNLDGDLVRIDGQRQARDAGALDKRRGGAQRMRLGGQRPGRDQLAG